MSTRISDVSYRILIDRRRFRKKCTEKMDMCIKLKRFADRTVGVMKRYISGRWYCAGRYTEESDAYDRLEKELGIEC